MSMSKEISFPLKFQECRADRIFSYSFMCMACECEFDFDQGSLKSAFDICSQYNKKNKQNNSSPLKAVQKIHNGHEIAE